MVVVFHMRWRDAGARPVAGAQGFDSGDQNFYFGEPNSRGNGGICLIYFSEGGPGRGNIVICLGGAGRVHKNLTFAGPLQFAKDGYSECFMDVSYSFEKAFEAGQLREFWLMPRTGRGQWNWRGRKGIGKGRKTKGVEAVLRAVYGDSDGRGQGNWQGGAKGKGRSARPARCPMMGMSHFEEDLLAALMKYGPHSESHDRLKDGSPTF